ncbi:hypothetical protein AB0442_02150 [Kitasatospora sp. NPDC085895]|uniref:hypothetical protein n=1 Tax=Kitasatospora sp. NPDC085895 TaxID=3155057 RepID=UPI00344CAC8F
MQLCYWCKKEVTDCPRCNGIFEQYGGKLETCLTCNKTGMVCLEHKGDWQGSVPCSSEISSTIDEWLEINMWFTAESLKREDIPFSTREELSYLAFASDLRASQADLAFIQQGLGALRWLIKCRNLAIEAGGREPDIMRAGPLHEPEETSEPAHAPAGQHNSDRQPQKKWRWWNHR